MKLVTIREARRTLTRLEEILEAEGEVTITRRGKAIARVLPVTEGVPAVPSHRALRRKMPRLRRTSATLIREDRDAR